MIEGGLIMAMAGIMSTKSMLLLVDCKYELINLRSKGQGGDMLHRLKVCGWSATQGAAAHDWDGATRLLSKHH